MIRAGRVLAAAGLVLVALVVSGSDDAVAAKAATLRTFAGHWYGHERVLTIDSTGHAVESISDGCCDRLVALHMTLSRPRGTTVEASASARVTYVHIYDPTAFGPKYPPPHPGETTMLHLANGVITESLTRINYCDMAADLRGTCGA